MPRALRLAVCLVLFLVTSAATSAASSATAQREPTTAFATVDAAAREVMEQQAPVGLAVAVIENGQVAWSAGYGFADREAETPVDPKATQFRWASISKSITAIAALQLAEQGKLDLDADVRQYVPEFPDKGVTVTSRQLLGHQGGIVHYSNGKVIRTRRDYESEHPFEDVVLALDTFKESPLINEPGTKYSYTTHGFILLSAVVQRAGDAPFAEQVKDRIAKPAGMDSFQPDYQWVDIPNRAVGYRKNRDDEIVRRPDLLAPDVSWKLGGGGYTSTVEDLARFGAALLREELVSDDSQQQMWTAHAPSDHPDVPPYGYGFSVRAARDGTTRVGHSGSQEKTRTCMTLVPERRCGVVIMTNAEYLDATAVATKLLNVYLDARP